MLLLVFEAGGQTYGLDARRVVQVAPYPACTPLPHAPPYVAGLVTWRGSTLPVIDLSALLGGAPARPLLSTRLVVIRYPQAPGVAQPLGLVAEKAVETVREEASRYEPQKIAIPDAPYLEGTVEHAGRIIQRISVEELLPASVRALLFPHSEGV